MPAPIYALLSAGMMFLSGGLLWMIAGLAVKDNEPGASFFCAAIALALQCGAVVLLLSARP